MTIAELLLRLIEGSIPSTYYAGAPLAWRVQKLVEDWQRAITVNQQLEKELLEALRKLEELKAR